MTEVSTQAELQAAVARQETEIVALGTISMASPTTIGYRVQIRGAEGASILWTGPRAGRPNLFTVTANGDLTLDALLFDAGDRDGSFVQVNGGKLTMNAGVVMRNIRSTQANGAVKVGDLAESYGGTFIMNGGLITAINTSDAVTNFGGTVEMHNDAAISDNMAAGITMSRPIFGGERSMLTMTGRSRISGNVSKQSGAAGIIMDSDIIMGVAPGDAPSVTGNRSPYSAGAWYITEFTKLTMRYDAEISGNQAETFAGGLEVVASELQMHDNASIKNNTCAESAGGLMLSARSIAAMDGSAQISGNTAPEMGGGVYMHYRAALSVAGDASIHGNTATDGAGIYLDFATATVGADGSSPGIYGNSAADNGGGVYVSRAGTLNVTGSARIYGNTAQKGKGVYDEGTVNLADSPTITDGLYFDDLPDGDTDSVWVDPMPDGYQVNIEDGRLVLSVTGQAEQLAVEPSDDVPIIIRTLTADARIQLEASPYVSPENVPLMISKKADEAALLGETDRAAWLLPPEFIPGYSVILNDAVDEVWISYTPHTITYHELHGAQHDNPDSYTPADLPLVLKAPGQRPGYTFVGWQTPRGVIVTEIPVGTDQDIDLIAIWQPLTLSFHENGNCVCNMPIGIPLLQGEAVRIPCVIPVRQGYCFLCWCTAPTGTGTIYVPGNTVPVAESGIALYARWVSAKCGDCEKCRYTEICALVDWSRQ